MFQFYKIYNLTCHEFHEFYISTEAGRHFWNKIDTHMCSLFLQKQSQISDENDECFYFFKYPSGMCQRGRQGGRAPPPLILADQKAPLGHAW